MARSIHRIIVTPMITTLLMVFGLGSRMHQDDAMQIEFPSFSTDASDLPIPGSFDDEASAQASVDATTRCEDGNSPGDDATQLNQVLCPKDTWGGVECMILCGTAGVGCTTLMLHPKNPDAGKGKLYECCGCKEKKHCGYVYDNGDQCTFYKDQKPAYLCKLAGGG